MVVHAGTGEISGAQASLAQGQGPANGEPLTCQQQGGSASVACGTPSAAASSAWRPASPAVSTPDWSFQPITPGGRFGMVMAYDAADKAVVLFGGVNGSGILGDTWTYNGKWTVVTPATSPQARYDAAMAYDYKDGYVVLFGGSNTHGAYLSDTWKYVHGTWTKLTPAKSPPGMDLATMSWDSNDSYMVLFGGYNGGHSLSATWTYVGGTWTQRASTGPPGRYLGQMAYDDRDGWIVLYGGDNSSLGMLGDTWNFSGGHWTQRHPSASPPASDAGAMANDSADGYLVLQSGTTSSGPLYLSWAFDNRTWTKLTASTPPSARQAVGFAYDPQLGKVLLYGGVGSFTGYLGDLWTYHANVWFRVVAPVPPDAAFGMMIYDEADQYVVFFGGTVFNGVTAADNPHTWTYSKGHWSQLTTKVAPTGRNTAAIAYDQADGYVLLFGGYSGTYGYFGDTWTFLAGKWTELYPTLAPTARSGSNMVYDAADGYVLLFGGSGVDPAGHIEDLNDAWSYAAGAWTPVDPDLCLGCGPVPPGSQGGAMVYDAADGVVMLFGGLNNTSGLENSTWLYSGGAWTNWTGSAGTPPSARWASTITYDGADGYVLLFSGYSSSGVIADSWEFQGGVWTRLTTTHSPMPAEGAAMAYDGAGGTVVLLWNTFTSTTSQTWHY